MMSIEQDERGLLDGLRSDWPALAPTARLAREAIARDPSGAADAELREALGAIDAYTAQGEWWPAYTGPAPWSESGWPDEAYVAAARAKLEYLRGLRARVELLLCVARTSIAQWAKRDPSVNEGALGGEVRAAIEAHRAHRRADRDAAVATARARLVLEKEHREALEARIARLEALDDDALLCDRGCTG